MIRQAQQKIALKKIGFNAPSTKKELFNAQNIRYTLLAFLVSIGISQ